MGHTYSDGEGEWDVHRLWELAKNLPVREVDPSTFAKEEFAWGDELNLGMLVEHMQRALAADLNYPIILSADGCVMDGNHRIITAWLGGELVKVVQFVETPAPDRTLV